MTKDVEHIRNRMPTITIGKMSGWLNWAKQTKRPVDLPMVARIIKEKKGQYVAIISFAQSKRHYHDELVYASTIKEAKVHLTRLYPTIKWRK